MTKHRLKTSLPLRDVISRLQNTAIAKSLTVGGAESCTGGLVSGALTAKSGSSQYFAGAIVSYSNEVKINALKVSRQILHKSGAVSGVVAMAMAKGAKKALSVDVAYAITGIAGPTGGTAQKPVGTVFFALFSGQEKAPVVLEWHFKGSRSSIRRQTVRLVILELLRYIEK